MRSELARSAAPALELAGDQSGLRRFATATVLAGIAFAAALGTNIAGVSNGGPVLGIVWFGLAAVCLRLAWTAFRASQILGRLSAFLMAAEDAIKTCVGRDPQEHGAWKRHLHVLVATDRRVLRVSTASPRRAETSIEYHDIRNASLNSDVDVLIETRGGTAVSIRTLPSAAHALVEVVNEHIPHDRAQSHPAC